MEKAQKLKEYMEKEFGVTPQNIDEKLEELKKNLFERGLVKSEKCEGVQ